MSLRQFSAEKSSFSQRGYKCECSSGTTWGHPPRACQKPFEIGPVRDVVARYLVHKEARHCRNGESFEKFRTPGFCPSTAVPLQNERHGRGFEMTWPMKVIGKPELSNDTKTPLPYPLRVREPRQTLAMSAGGYYANRYLHKP